MLRGEAGLWYAYCGIIYRGVIVSVFLSTSKVFLLLSFCRSKATTVSDMNGLKSLTGNKVFLC